MIKWIAILETICANKWVLASSKLLATNYLFTNNTYNKIGILITYMG